MKNQGIQVLTDNDCNVIIACNAASEREFQKEAQDVDAIILRFVGKVTETVIQKAKNLKVIGRHGVGLDNVDVTAATKRGIPVVYTPEANSESVADHVLGLMLALAHRIPRIHNAVTLDNNWKIRENENYYGNDVWKRTLGVIGYGRIGKGVVTRAKGFNMKILFYDIQHFDDEDAQQVSLEELLQASDFISVNLPLTEETRHLLTRKEFEMMNDNAYLINTSRGGVIDEDALYNALKNGKLKGAGLDVLQQEPPDPQNPLLSLENVIITPHMASSTHESMMRMALTVSEEIVKVLHKQKPQFIANPEVLQRR